jgi:hypothetical protein
MPLCFWKREAPAEFLHDADCRIIPGRKSPAFDNASTHSASSGNNSWFCPIWIDPGRLLHGPTTILLASLGTKPKSTNNSFMSIGFLVIKKYFLSLFKTCSAFALNCYLVQQKTFLSVEALNDCANTGVVAALSLTAIIPSHGNSFDQRVTT